MASGHGSAFDSEEAQALTGMDGADDSLDRGCAPLGKGWQGDSGCPGLCYVTGFKGEQISNGPQVKPVCRGECLAGGYPCFPLMLAVIE